MIFQGLIDNAVNIGVTAGIALALGVALKKLPDMLEAKVQAAIDKLFAMGDAADDEFLVAAIHWAESKYGAGSGAVKAQACVDKILGLLPVHYRLFVSKGSRDKAIALFQQSFDRLEAVAKKAQEPK
jgi:hypothetical protein